MALTINDVLTRCVLTISPETLLVDAVRIMTERKISCLVATEDNKPVGILTESNLVLAARLGSKLDHLTARDYLSPPVVSIATQQSIYAAFEYLLENQVRHLVITHPDGTLEGLLSLTDLLKATELDDYLTTKQVSTVMNRNLVTVKPDTALRQALEQMATLHISSVVVMMEGQAIGIFTERDAARLLAQGADMQHLSVQDVMTAPLLTLHYQSSLLDAATIMRGRGIRRLVIVDDAEQPLGIVTQFDVIHGLEGQTIRHFRMEQEALEESLVEHQLLLKEKSELERIVDASPAVLYRCQWQPADEQFVLTYVNAAASSMLGYHHHEAYQIDWWQAHIHPDDREAVLEAIAQSLQASDLSDQEYRIRHHDGHYIWVHDHARLYRNEVGQPWELVGSWQDISARRHKQAALMSSEARYRSLFDDAQDMIHITDAQGFITDVNQAELSTLAYNREAMVGRCVLDFIAPDFQDHCRHVLPRVLAGEAVTQHETVLLTSDGKRVWVEISATPQYNLAGEVVAARAISRDISERKAREEAYRIVAERNQRILTASMDGIIIHNEQGRIIDVNPAYCTMSGFDRERLLQMCINDIEAALEPNQAQHMMENIKQQGAVHFQTRHHHHDGSVFDVDVSAVPLPQEDGSILIAGFVRDMRAQLQQEGHMRLLNQAVTAIHESVMITDATGVIVYVNPAFSEHTGYHASEAIGKTPRLLNSKQQSKAFYAHFWDVISSGKPWSGRILDRKKDGTIFPVMMSVAPIFDQDGNISHYVAVHEDLSKNESLQKNMMQAQRMEAVGMIVGGIAHDFNNILACIIGNFYLIRMMRPDDAKLLERITSIEDATHNGAKMIRQMLSFARHDQADMQPLLLNAFIKETYKLVAASLPENITLDLRVPQGDSYWVNGDATQLQQIVLNLITNARHALAQHEHGHIILELNQQPPASALLEQQPEYKSDTGWCSIHCIDNGCGINAEHLAHIFDPFFTTREAGVGTGLGLAMVQNAMMQHRGLVDVQSEPGKGSHFSLYLPLQANNDVVDTVSKDIVRIAGDGKGVLIVDDEAALRQVLRDVLQHNGFTVWEASDGEQAIKCYLQNRARIHLVLSDIVMPNMGGIVAAKEIHAVDPTLPIILQTGHGEDTQQQAMDSIEHGICIQKPVNIPDLMHLISGLLTAMG
jgi:PAS domain S-box-containing protein